MATKLERVGVVVIGRNEGERLRRCLASVVGRCHTIVYVDSGSTDHSVQCAREQGVEIVELDTSMPFSAARARNAGFKRLMQLEPAVKLIQFIDGDCELADGWLERAAQSLHKRLDVAVVCGRVHERHPEASIYNRLCDLEFDRKTGVVPACGGIFMACAEAFEQVGGLNPAVVAGEEPEFCLRIRRAGWKVMRLSDDMVWHDAANTSFNQWWKRMVRGGQAYAQGMAMHGRERERFCVRRSLSIWFWALLLPLLAVALPFSINGWTQLILVLYPLQIAQIAVRRRGTGDSPALALVYASFCVLAKWPQLLGQIRFWLLRLAGRPASLVEYKQPGDKESMAALSEIPSP